MCLSLNTEKEAVYAATKSGVAATWRARFADHAFSHPKESAHEIEKLIHDVLIQADMSWASEFLEDLSSI